MKGLKARIYGFESEIDYLLTDRIKLFTNLSINRGENLTDKIPLSYMPPDKIIFSTEIDLKSIKLDFIFKKVFN